MYIFYEYVQISIHAPSRERLWRKEKDFSLLIFQSTLPRGSDQPGIKAALLGCYFNPRSLAGATISSKTITGTDHISIHAPSRERLMPFCFPACLPQISIHAPSRERPGQSLASGTTCGFQSTLPRGSDIAIFNILGQRKISIHAPSRERPLAISARIL